MTLPFLFNVVITAALGLNLRKASHFTLISNQNKMLSLDLLVLVLLSRADDPVYVYNATNIQLLRMAIVPSFQGDTLLAMSCDDLRSIEVCPPSSSLHPVFSFVVLI